MKGKTTVMTALLFTLSLSPVWVMAEDEINTLPLPQKQACADSETSVWCADTSDVDMTYDVDMVEPRHPLAALKAESDEDDCRSDYSNLELGGFDEC